MSQLEQLSAEAGHPWDSELLLRWGDDVLRWMRACGEKRPEQHLRFRCIKGVIQLQVLQGGDLPERLRQLLARGPEDRGPDGEGGAHAPGMGHGAEEQEYAYGDQQVHQDTRQEHEQSDDGGDGAAEEL